MGKEPLEPGLRDAAPCLKEYPGVLVPREHFGDFGWKTASEGEASELLTRALSPCFSKLLFARINKFLWFMSRTKLGLSKDVFQAVTKVEVFVLSAALFAPRFLPPPTP